MRFKDIYLDCKHGICSENVKTFLTPQTIEHCANYLYHTIWQDVDQVVEHTSERHKLLVWFIQQDWFFKHVDHDDRIEMYGSFELLLLYLSTIQRHKYIHWKPILDREFSIEQTKQLMQQCRNKPIQLRLTRWVDDLKGDKMDWIFHGSFYDSEQNKFLFRWDQECGDFRSKLFSLTGANFVHFFEKCGDSVRKELAHVEKEFVEKGKVDETYREIVPGISEFCIFQIVFNIAPTFCGQFRFDLFLNAYKEQKDDLLFCLWDMFDDLKTKPIFQSNIPNHCFKFKVVRAVDNLQECVDHFHNNYLLKPLDENFEQFSEIFPERFEKNWKLKLRWKQVEVVNPHTLYIQLQQIPCFDMDMFKNNEKFQKMKQMEKTFKEVFDYVGRHGVVLNSCIFVTDFRDLTNDSLKRIQWKVQNQIPLKAKHVKRLFLHHCSAETEENAAIALWMFSILLHLSKKKIKPLIQKGFEKACQAKCGGPIVNEIQKHFHFSFQPVQTECTLLSALLERNLDLVHTMVEQEPQCLAQFSMDDCKSFVFEFKFNNTFNNEVSKKDRNEIQAIFDWIFPTFYDLFDKFWDLEYFDEFTGRNKSFGFEWLFRISCYDFPLTIFWLVENMPSIRIHFMTMDLHPQHYCDYFAIVRREYIQWTDVVAHQQCSVCYDSFSKLKHAACQHLYCKDCSLMLSDACLICCRLLYRFE